MSNAMAYKIMITYKEIEPVLRELEKYPYAIVKGEPLSIFAYNSTGKRASSDVDILIHRKNIKFLRSALNSYGYIQQFSNDIDKSQERIIDILSLSGSHQVRQFTKRAGVFNTNVDANFDIFWGEYTGKRIDIDEFLSDTIEMEIYNCKIKTLPPLKAMVQLILHHYKEMNSIYHIAKHNCIKYGMFKDVYHLLKNSPEDISPDLLYKIGSDYEILPYIFYVLYLTSQVFDDETLKHYVKIFHTKEGEGLLEYYGLSDKEKKRWRVDFKTRLETESMYELIKDDLTELDMEKLERSRLVFG